MRVYEVLFIVAPNTEEGDIETLVAQLRDVLTNQGAQVTNVNRMGRRRLAYLERKKSKAKVAATSKPAAAKKKVAPKKPAAAEAAAAE